MKDMGKLVIRLLIITAVAGLVLAGANQITQPVIAKQQEEKLKASLTEIWPTMTDVKAIDSQELSKILPEKSGVQEVFKVSAPEGEGHILRVISKGGFGGAIEFLAGINKEAKIVGFKVLNHSETPGYGDASTEPFFAEGIIGNTIEKEITYAKEPSTDSDIQAISGATITTKCITRGLNDAAAVARELK